MDGGIRTRTEGKMQVLNNLRICFFRGLVEVHERVAVQCGGSLAPVFASVTAPK